MSAEEATAAPAAEETKAQNPFAALGGSGLTFGNGTGGFAFGGFAAPAAKPAEGEGEGDGEGDDAEGADEEECAAQFAPIVQLEEVETKSGEEDEEVLVDLKCKLYRFDNDNNEWKERGIGQAKLLKHKENKKIRMLMRQEKTLKIRANHLVLPGTKLQEHTGSDKAWVWSTVDFAEEKQKVELFCIRFGSVEKAQEFKKKFEEAEEENGKLLGALPAAATEEAEAAKEADKLAAEVEEKAAV